MVVHAGKGVLASMQSYGINFLILDKELKNCFYGMCGGLILWSFDIDFSMSCNLSHFQHVDS